MRRLFSSLALLFLLFAAPARAGEIKLATWNLNWLTTRAPGDPLLPPELPGRGAEDFVRLHLYAQRLAADVLALEEVAAGSGLLRLVSDLVLTGTAGADLLSGGSGRDTLRGDGGADYLDGGDDNDRLDGAGGADRLRGGLGHDSLYGGSENDELLGGEGNDADIGSWQ